MLRAVRHSFEQHRAARKFAHLAKHHPLRYLFLEVTRKCNLSCTYCGSGCSPSWSNREMESSGWIRVLHQIAEDFPPKEVMLAITGGEPLLKPGFFDIIAEADTLGFPYGMVTNGGLLDREAARKLAASRIGAISISFDAPPELNDTLRGKGTARRVEQAITNLRKAGYKRRLEIISTIVKPAVPNLHKLREHIAGMKVAEWRLAPVIPIGRAAGTEDLIPDAADIRAILEFVKAGRADGLLPKPEFGEECYLGPSYEGTVRPFKYLCRAGLTVGGILCDGRIGACPELPDCFVQGDIHTDRFKDVWQTRYQALRDRAWTRRGTCASCDSFGACQGGSLHLYRDLDGQPIRCFYKMLEAD